MRYYPLFLDIQQKALLVVGAGAVGARKVLSLLAASPHSITVIDPSPPKESQELFSHPSISLLIRGFLPDDIQGKALVFAATNNHTVNKHIASLCMAHNILCNIADAPDQSDFTVPAFIQNGPITIAIGTQGASPALTRHLRKELEAWLGNRYTGLAIVLGRLRPLALAHEEQTAINTALFRQLVESPLATFLEKNHMEQAHNLLKELLPETLQAYIGDLLHGL